MNPNVVHKFYDMIFSIDLSSIRQGVPDRREIQLWEDQKRSGKKRGGQFTGFGFFLFFPFPLTVIHMTSHPNYAPHIISHASHTHHTSRTTHTFCTKRLS